MLSPPFLENTSKVDPRKVRAAQFRYRLIFLWVLTVNVLLDLFCVYLLTSNMLTALMLTGLCLGASLFVLTVAGFMLGSNKFKNNPELVELNIPKYHECVAEWERCCRKINYRSGGVYIYRPHENKCLGDSFIFGVGRAPFLSRTPVLIISERVFGRFSREEIEAAMAHECGHLLYPHQLMLAMMEFVSLPVSRLLVSLYEMRRMFPRARRIGIMLYCMERGLYVLSRFYAHHALEYFADAHAAREKGTTLHHISLLLELEYRWLSTEIKTARNALFHRKKESHLHVHQIGRASCRERV